MRARLLGVLVALALLANGPSLANRFAYDDVAAVLQNPKVHALRAPWEPFRESYWSGQKCCSLYRPVAILAYSLEWNAGGGEPWVFHAVNVALICLASALVFELGLMMLPMGPSFLAAAAFAVHPVHVEAVANIIGQAELWMTVATVAATIAYIGARRAVQPSFVQQVTLLLLASVATFSKEQGVTLPALLLFAELFVVRPTHDGGERAARARALLTVGVLGVLLALAVRVTAVTGLGQGLTAAGLIGLTGAQRVAVAVGTIPTWARLLLWPESLSAEYAPPAYGPALGHGLPFIGGLAIAGLVIALIAWSWTRRPAVAFGLLWFIAALSPVSNFLFPTGIVVAERTLMLPSVGIVIAAGDLGWWAWSSVDRPVLRRGLLAVAGLLLALGVARSMSRSRVWHSTQELFVQMPLDSPRSFRAYKMYSMVMLARADTAAQIRALDQGIALWDRDTEMLEDRGQLARIRQGCRAAIPFFRRALEVDRTVPRARSRLFACLLETGDVEGAREVAKTDPEGDLDAYRRLLAHADSLRAVRDSTQR
jgi:hypothetical protein